MEETTEQKIIRNIQGNFAIFKTPDVIGEKTMMANIEWEDPNEIDKFFMFAKNLGAKIIYLSEGEEEDEATGQTKNTILQVGFMNQSVMHYISFIEDEEDEDDEEEDEYEEEETVEPQTAPINQVPQQQMPQAQQQQQNQASQAPQQSQQQAPQPTQQQQFGGPSNF